MSEQPARPTDGRFGVVVPVKRLAVAKSRLDVLGDAARRELVAAFAADTVAAALDCPTVGAVMVVTDELGLALSLRDLGAAVIPDGQPGDLNASLQQGAAELARTHPELRPVALCGDLPALVADDLDAALRAAPADGAAFVPDAAGVGTTLYTASSADFVPRFGQGSREAHLAAGAAELPAAPSVRRDVDTPDDLADALSLGVGPRTSFVVTLHRLDVDHPAPGAP